MFAFFCIFPNHSNFKCTTFVTIEVAKKIDDDEDDENKPKETKPIEPISTVIKKKLQRTKHFSGRVTEFIIHLLNVSFVEL